ncbi:MAG TPA: hypothetical protein VIT92_01385, partial [Burkholderiaceae bacterium]
MLAAGIAFLAAACGGSSSVSYTAPPNTPPVTPPVQTGKAISGKVVDGYVAGATVTLDLNDDRICSAGEPTATSNTVGTYSFSAAANSNGGDHMVCSS